MIQNNNLSVLPFYTALDQQNHRQSYAYGETYALYSPSGYLLPFQIITTHSTSAFSVTDAIVYTLGGTQVASIGQYLVDGGLLLCPTAHIRRDLVQ